ncbi:pantoate--beta-alanine ligase [Algoriphagus namhaensis]
MKVLTLASEWHPYRLQSIQNSKKIGFVPTMGALHQGHLDLVHACKQQADVTIVSIFVNPTQFNNPQDYKTYPKTLEKDLELLEKQKVDYVFVPDVADVYPEKVALTLDFGDLERVLEGHFRPGHFSGVGIVVSKLFHMIQPDLAFFGQKDLQQVAIIRRLVQDLSFPVHLEIVPTRREKDGLALSSRNMRLDKTERTNALTLYTSLQKAKKELLAGMPWLGVRQEVEEIFRSTPHITLEYFELVHPTTFAIREHFDPGQKNSICVAAFVGEVRLIDNLPVID